MARNGMRILDSDMHVLEPHDLYLNYMDSKWGDRIPRGEPRTQHGMMRYKLGDGTPIFTPSKAVDHHDTNQHTIYEESFKRDYDPISQLSAMDVEGLDVAVLFRTRPLFTDESFEPEYANAICRAWNDWIADFCKEKPERLKPSAVITLHDVDMAVEETRRAVTDLGAVGLSIGPEPVNGRQIHDRYFDPLWAEAERLGVPICFHPPASPAQPQVSQRFRGHPNEYLLVNSLRNPIEIILAIGAFCAGGVLEKFPKLRVAFLEGNCSWLPWLLYRLDEHSELQGPLADVPLSRKPSDYFLEQCVISVDVDEALAASVIEKIGDGSLIFSTDYPHNDSSWPHAVEIFNSIEEISEASKRKIFWDNCARLYGMN